MQWVPSSEFNHDDSLVIDFARLNPSKPVPSATRTFANTAEGSSDTAKPRHTSTSFNKPRHARNPETRRIASRRMT